MLPPGELEAVVAYVLVEGLPPKLFLFLGTKDHRLTQCVHETHKCTRQMAC